MVKVPREPSLEKLRTPEPPFQELPVGTWLWRLYFRGGRHPVRWSEPRHVGPLDGHCDRTITVTQCGRICFGRQKINVSTVFAGQNVGVKQVDDKIWLVSFMRYDLGYFDHETCRLESAENPFGAKVLPISPELTVT